MIRILQQRNKCIGCNACVEAAHSRWRMSRKDGKSVDLGGGGIIKKKTVIVHDDELEENQLAAKNCPVNIIQLIPIQ